MSMGILICSDESHQLLPLLTHHKAAAADSGQLAAAPALKSIAKPFSLRELGETLDELLPGPS